MILQSSFQSHLASMQNCSKACRRAALWAHNLQERLVGMAKHDSFAEVHWWVDGDVVEVEDGFCVVRWIVHVARERVHSGKWWMRIAVIAMFFQHKT